MTQKSHTEKVALVTGASRGIGAAIAKRLALDGFTIAVNYASRTSEALAVVQEIKQAGGHALAIQADVSDPKAVTELFDQTEHAFGGIDVLVNNAGIIQFSSIAETKDEMFDRLVDINFKGSFNTMREAAWRLRNYGRIINFSTSVVGLKFPTYGLYAATKAAIETLTPILAKELRGRNITVNAVAPGPTATELFLNGKTQEQIEHLRQQSPLERLGEPDDIASAVAFLAGPDGEWINGQTIRVNGGII